MHSFPPEHAQDSVQRIESLGKNRIQQEYLILGFSKSILSKDSMQEGCEARLVALPERAYLRRLLSKHEVIATRWSAFFAEGYVRCRRRKIPRHFERHNRCLGNGQVGSRISESSLQKVSWNST